MWDGGEVYDGQNCLHWCGVQGALLLLSAGYQREMSFSAAQRQKRVTAMLAHSSYAFLPLDAVCLSATDVWSVGCEVND